MGTTSGDPNPSDIPVAERVARWSSRHLAGAAIVGLVVVIVGIGMSSPIGAVGMLLGLGVAVPALVVAFRRAVTVGRFVLTVAMGAILLVGGLALGIQSYDERFIFDSADREFWDAVGLVGFLAAILGLLTLVTSSVGLVVAVIIRAVRS